MFTISHIQMSLTELQLVVGEVKQLKREIPGGGGGERDTFEWGLDCYKYCCLQHKHQHIHTRMV